MAAVRKRRVLSPLARTLAEYRADEEDLKKNVAHARQVEDKGDAQSRAELQILRDNRLCLGPISPSLLSMDRISATAETRFYDPKAMESLLCTAASVYYSNEGAFRPSQRIRRWIRGLSYAASSTAQIERGSIDREPLSSGRSRTRDRPPPEPGAVARDFFVIKSPKNNDRGQGRDLAHELFVGLYGTNRLREHVSNFAYVYGGWTCAGIFFADQKASFPFEGGSAPLWCADRATNNRVPYIAYENVRPAISMREFAEKATFEQFVSAYVQVLFALELAHREIDFTHYDLHGDNVLIRQLPRQYEQRYYSWDDSGRRTPVYLTSNKLAVIIDFDMTHIRWNGSHYGLWTTVPRIFGDRSFLPNDAFKLLANVHGRLHEQNANPALRDGLVRLMRLFEPTATAEQAAKLKASYYTLPYREPYLSIRIDEIRRAALRMVGDPWWLSSESRPDSAKLYCAPGLCQPDVSSAFLALESGKLVPDNVFDFVDLAQQYENTGQREKLDQLLRAPRLTEVYARDYALTFEKYDRLLSDLGQVAPISAFDRATWPPAAAAERMQSCRASDDQSIAECFASDNGRLRDYAQYMYMILSLFNDLFDVLDLLEAFEKLLARYPNRELAENAIRWRRTLRTEARPLEGHVRGILEDGVRMTDVKSTERLQFLKVNLPIFASMFNQSYVDHIFRPDAR